MRYFLVSVSSNVVLALTVKKYNTLTLG